jgi:glycosyltransferase involved in cell wall biosynthesis
VVDGETGWLVPPGDAAALANALLGVLQDRALAAKLGRNGRVRVEERFTVARMVEANERLYEAI